MDIEKQMLELAEVDITKFDTKQQTEYLNKLNNLLEKEPNNVDLLLLKALFLEFINEYDNALNILYSLKELDLNKNIKSVVDETFTRIKTAKKYGSTSSIKQDIFIPNLLKQMSPQVIILIKLLILVGLFAYFLS